MPLSRYKVRNEYSLADPELYKAADKDDPEALLEGVAMAGLVGVLRQLGDLAEFAAEIFHDLHEEVMATAARGHGLLIRVQQLESEFPSIERAFLSQTGHSAFFPNPGIDWHPNLQTEQNLITKGDLPRFVMDSYEECRGPPRLFLLDKFDVAGAGACLKRYTDPSFYKVEASSYEMESAKTQRDQKILKTKKKGSRWKNGGTPEVLQPSHVKLHQLFLEERVQNGVTEPARRVKLKNRPNKFPFDTENGRNYMEKLLQSPSQDKLVHEVPAGSLPFRLPSENADELGLEILEVSFVGSASHSMNRSKSVESTDDISGNIAENLGSEADSVSSELHEEIDDKHVADDGEIKTDAIQDGYRSDDVASEIENYVDALNTMDSEIETDTELRAKTDPTIKQDAKQIQSQFSDSHSIGNSTASDDENNSIMKGLTHFSYSDSTSISVDNTSPAAVDSPPQAFACIEIPFRPRVPPNQVSDTEKIPMTQNPDDEGTILKESTSKEPGLNEMSSNYSEDHDSSSKIEENKIDLEDTFASTLKPVDIPSPTTDNSPSLSISRNPETEVANEDPNASFSPTREISGNSLRKVIENEYGEEISSTHSVDSRCSSPNSVISHANEQPIVPSLESEICDPDGKTSEATYADDISVVEETLDPDTRSLPKVQLQETGDGLVVHKSDSAEATASDSSDCEAEIEEREIKSINSETQVGPDAVDKTGDNGCCTLENETELVDRETSVNSGIEVVNTPVYVPNDKNEGKDLSTVEDDTELVERETESVNSKTEAGVTAFASIGVDKNEDNGLSLVEEPDEHAIHDFEESGEKKEFDKHSIISPDIFSDASDTASYDRTDTCGHVNENDGKSPSANLKILQDESHGFLEDTDQNGPQEVVSPDLDSRPGDIAPCEHSNVQVLDGAGNPTEADASLLTNIVTAVSSSSEYINRDLESESLNQSYQVDEFEATSSISRQLTPLESKVDQPIDQINRHSLASGGNSQLERVDSLTNVDHETSFATHFEPYPMNLESKALVQEEELQPEQCAMELIKLPQESSHEVDFSDEVKYQSTPMFSGFALLPQLAPINLEEMPPLPPLPPMQWRMGKLQNASSAPRTDDGQHNVDHFPPNFPSKSHEETQIVGYPTLENQKSEHSYEDLGDGVVTFSQPLSTEDRLHTEKHDEASISSEANALNFAENMAEPVVEMDQSCNVSTSGQKIFWPPGTSSLPLIDDERPNGIRPMKIQRPRSPLIDAVAAHDKSKLRKVSERARPQIPKEEERDTLLEQIRAKSFNLKPAIHTRPSIQGPKTNLRVAAILEKANAIRQAFAGSDDDEDEDSWSDS